MTQMSSKHRRIIEDIEIYSVSGRVAGQGYDLFCRVPRLMQVLKSSIGVLIDLLNAQQINGRRNLLSLIFPIIPSPSQTGNTNLYFGDICMHTV